MVVVRRGLVRRGVGAAGLGRPLPHEPVQVVDPEGIAEGGTHVHRRGAARPRVQLDQALLEVRVRGRIRPSLAGRGRVFPFVDGGQALALGKAVCLGGGPSDVRLRAQRITTSRRSRL